MSKRSLFFDYLAICVDVRTAPKKRQFWGWWLVLRPEEKYFIYSYQFGLYTQNEQWMVKKISEAHIQQQLETTFTNFYQRLNQMLASINWELKPEPNINVFPNITRFSFSE